MAGDFRIETLLNHAKELQQEKQGLDHKLQKIRNVRRQMENALEAVTAECSQARLLNNKMQETLSVAQHKVAQTQAQVNSLERINSEKRNNLDRLNEQVKQMEKNKITDIEDFEKKLSDLVEGFLTAKDYYKSDNLSKEIQQTDRDISCMQNTVDESKQEMDGLDREMSSLNINTEDVSVDGLPIPLQEAVLKDLRQENAGVSQQAEEMTSQAQAAQRKLESLTTCYRRLQSQIG